LTNWDFEYWIWKGVWSILLAIAVVWFVCLCIGIWQSAEGKSPCVQWERQLVHQDGRDIWQDVCVELKDK
jgi:hypothetical protein